MKLYKTRHCLTKNCIGDNKTFDKICRAKNCKSQISSISKVKTNVPCYSQNKPRLVTLPKGLKTEFDQCEMKENQKCPTYKVPIKRKLN